jgi:hypothetical protein
VDAPRGHYIDLAEAKRIHLEKRARQEEEEKQKEATRQQKAQERAALKAAELAAKEAAKAAKRAAKEAVRSAREAAREEKKKKKKRQQEDKRSAADAEDGRRKRNRPTAVEEGLSDKARAEKAPQHRENFARNAPECCPGVVWPLSRQARPTREMSPRQLENEGSTRAPKRVGVVQQRRQGLTHHARTS